MKRKILFLFAFESAFASILHFKLDKVKDVSKSFRESTSLLQDKYSQSISELSRIASELEEEQSKIMKKGDKVTEKEKKEFQSKLLNFQLTKIKKQEELSRYSKLLDEQNRKEIKDVVSSGISDFCLIDSSTLLYGGEDVTKFVIDKLSGKRGSLSLPHEKIKVGYVDTAKFMNSSEEAKNLREFVDEKIKKFHERQKELLDEQDKNDKDFDLDAAEKELRELSEDANSAQQLILEQIDKGLKNTARFLAKTKGYDLIVNKELVYSGGDDLTQDFINEYGREEDFSSSKVAFVNLNKVLDGYKRYQNIKSKHDNQRETFDEELSKKYENIQKMKDEGKSEAEIKKAEEEFGRERTVRAQSLLNTVKDDEEKVMNDIKSAARRVANSKKIKVIMLDSEVSIGSYFAGSDISEEILSSLNG